MLQSQLNGSAGAERRAEQQLAATRRLESALWQARPGASLAEGTEAAPGCTLAKANLPSGRRNRPNMMPFSSKSLLCGHRWRRRRPATQTEAEAESAILTTGAKSTRNACRRTASLSRPKHSRKPVKGASGPVAGAIHSAILAASRFSDRRRSSPRCWMTTAQRLTQLKQTLEQQLQQATALCEQATWQHEAHLGAASAGGR